MPSAQSPMMKAVSAIIETPDLFTAREISRIAQIEEGLVKVVIQNFKGLIHQGAIDGNGEQSYFICEQGLEALRVWTRIRWD